LFYKDASLHAVEVGERMADGMAREDEIRLARLRAECPTFGYDFEEEFWRNYWRNHPESNCDTPDRLVEMGALSESVYGGEWAVDEEVAERLRAAACLAYACLWTRPDEEGWYYTKWYADWFTKVAWPGHWLMDCVFGALDNPSSFDLASAPSEVVGLARKIYDDRCFDRLPELGDLLAPICDDPRILDHCNSPESHVRGCWVVDLVLGFK
jgi:hypothetical protein